MGRFNLKTILRDIVFLLIGCAIFCVICFIVMMAISHVTWVQSDYLSYDQNTAESCIKKYYEELDQAVEYFEDNQDGEYHYFLYDYKFKDKMVSCHQGNDWENEILLPLEDMPQDLQPVFSVGVKNIDLGQTDKGRYYEFSYYSILDYDQGILYTPDGAFPDKEPVYTNHFVPLEGYDGWYYYEYKEIPFDEREYE